MARLVGGAVHPVERAVVAQRHHPGAGGMPDAEWRKAVLQPDTALNCHNRCDLPQPLRPGDIGRPRRRQKDVRMRGIDAEDDIDLL